MHDFSIKKCDVYNDKLDDIVNKYNSKYHRTIKMKAADLKPSIYIDINKKKNKEGPKFNVGNPVGISKYKNIFTKGNVPNWSEEVFVTKKVKNTVLRTCAFSDFNSEEILGMFYQKELQKNKLKRV